jgi:hypothetical protein
MPTTPPCPAPPLLLLLLLLLPAARRLPPTRPSSTCPQRSHTPASSYAPECRRKTPWEYWMVPKIPPLVAGWAHHLGLCPQVCLCKAGLTDGASSCSPCCLGDISISATQL